MGAQEGEEVHPPGSALQTPPAAAWVYTLGSSVTSSSERGALINDHHARAVPVREDGWVGTGIFKHENSHQPRFEHGLRDLRGEKENVLVSSRAAPFAASWVVDLRRVLENAVHGGW